MSYPYLFFIFVFYSPRVWSHTGTLGLHPSCVHSTRVVFIPSKDKIRVRVPMDAHGGLLYMVAYNLRKVENRDRYPDPPSISRRHSIGAVPRLVAPVAPVRFRVAASFYFIFSQTRKTFFSFVSTGSGAGHWRFASIAQLAEHALSKRKVTSSTLVGGWRGFVWSSLVMTLA